jgi:multidrug resistance efflux pump
VVDTDDYKKRLDDARDKANKTKDDLKTAQEDFDKVKDMDKNNAARKTAEDKLTKAQRDFDQAVRDRDLLISDMDVARGGVELAKARLDNAAATRDARKNGADPADQALADARLKNAKAQLAAAQAALGRADLVAPYDSTVTKVSVSVGEQAMPEQAAIQVADLAKWTVETSDLTEKDVVNVSAGQKVTVVPDALPDLKLTGTVDAIANGFVEKSGDITYMVRIPLETTDPLLRWGMTVNVTFAK